MLGCLPELLSKRPPRCVALYRAPRWRSLWSASRTSSTARSLIPSAETWVSAGEYWPHYRTVQYTAPWEWEEKLYLWQQNVRKKKAKIFKKQDSSNLPSRKYKSNWHVPFTKNILIILIYNMKISCVFKSNNRFWYVYILMRYGELPVQVFLDQLQERPGYGFLLLA